MCQRPLKPVYDRCWRRTSLIVRMDKLEMDLVSSASNAYGYNNDYGCCNKADLITLLSVVAAIGGAAFFLARQVSKQCSVHIVHMCREITIVTFLGEHQSSSFAAELHVFRYSPGGLARYRKPHSGHFRGRLFHQWLVGAATQAIQTRTPIQGRKVANKVPGSNNNYGKVGLHCLWNLQWTDCDQCRSKRLARKSFVQSCLSGKRQRFHAGNFVRARNQGRQRVLFRRLKEMNWNIVNEEVEYM